MDTDAVSLLEFAMKQTPLAGVLMFIAYRFYKDKAKSDELVLGLVEKCTVALTTCTNAINNNNTLISELKAVVANLQTEVSHVASHSQTQQIQRAG